MIGLFIESFALVPFALIFYYYLAPEKALALQNYDLRMHVLLAGSGFLTTLPLFYFSAAAKLLSLSTLGLMQYIEPSLHFLLAIFIFHEPLKNGESFTFMLIWLAIAIYSFDSFQVDKRSTQRKKKRPYLRRYIAGRLFNLPWKD